MSTHSYFEYRVKSGDALSLIMLRFFGVGPRSKQYQFYLDYLLKLNPHIKNPNQIQAGSLLRLGVIPPEQTIPSPKPLPNTPIQLPSLSGMPVPSNEFVLNNVSAQTELDFWLLSWLAERSNYLTVPGSIAMGAQSNLLNPANIFYVDKISDIYAQYKAGKLTKGQYDYARKQALKQLSQNIGPLDKWLFGDKTPQEAIRIARGGGIPATANITKHSSRLNQLASLGKYGGYALAGVGVAASCMQIANTDDRHEKNEIFVETIASTTVGLALGAAVGLFLISNPIGWGTALVLAAGTTATGYISGKIAKHAYSSSGERVDFVSGAGVDKICR